MTTIRTASRHQPDGGVFRWARQVGENLQRRDEDRKALRALRSLDDRMLADIGLHRSQINAAVYGKLER